MSTQIAIPFALANDGTIAVETILDRQVRQRVDAVVGTEPQERVMLPDFGVPGKSLLFESNDQPTEQLLTTAVTNSLASYEPGVTVTAVNSVQTDDGVAGVEVDYVLTQGQTSASYASTNTATIYSTGTVVEEVQG